MDERGVRYTSGPNKQGWEMSEFPSICETCLGNNPYLKMMKDKFGDECKICKRPYTVFKWKACAQGRFKRTVVCQTCAKLKNVCQTCLFDLTYGLPVELRDKMLGENKVIIPKSQANLDYWSNQANTNLDNMMLPYQQKEEQSSQLKSVQRTNPYYDRNKPKTCTFWLKGECNRGNLCPYLHEKHEDESLSKQNISDRFHGINDPLAKKIMGKMNNMQQDDITPPTDINISSLQLRNLTPEITAQDIQSVFSQFGPIVSVKRIQNTGNAYINFASRASADQAIKTTHNKLKIRDIDVRVCWSKHNINTNNQEQQNNNIQNKQIKPPFQPPLELNQISQSQGKPEFVATTQTTQQQLETQAKNDTNNQKENLKQEKQQLQPQEQQQQQQQQQEQKDTSENKRSEQVEETKTNENKSNDQ